MIKKSLLNTFLCVFFVFGACAKSDNINNNATNADIYKDLPFQMEEIKKPSFPNNEVKITDFGAVGDGMTLNTKAFADAIHAVAQKGGGKVVIPSGVWYTGPIVLTSNINIHAEEGALIVFSTDFNDYPLISTVFEGLDTKRCQSPISAEGAENIAITGKGIFNGSGDAWRPVKKEKMTAGQWKSLIASGGVLNEKGNMWFPSEGALKGNDGANMNVPNAQTEEEWIAVKDFLRPVMLSLKNCKNIWLEGVAFENSPSWNLHPFACENLIFENLTVRNPWYSQNGDGLDLESCKNALIIGCSFDVGDDAICIKSGKDEDGRKRGIPSENVIVKECVVYHGHGGFVVGSEMSGGVRNISVSDCQFIGTDVGLRFKSCRGRGGVVENIYISGINMINIPAEPLLFDLYYGGKSAMEAMEAGEDQQKPETVIPPVTEETPAFRNIFIKDIACRGANRALFFNGLPEMNIQNVHIENANIYAKKGGELHESTGVSLKNVHIVPQSGPAIILNNVKDLTADNFTYPKEMQEPILIKGELTKNVKFDNIEKSMNKEIAGK